MNRVAFDVDLPIKLRNDDNILGYSPYFIEDIQSNNELTMFWFGKFKYELPNDSDIVEFTPESNPDYTVYKIKTDKFDETKLLMDVSGSGIYGLDQDDLKFDVYRIIGIYYKNSNNEFKLAFSFDANSMESILLNYSRNILLIDLSKFNIKFKFKSSYRYSISEVAYPLYQHYHKTNLNYDGPSESDSSNVLDGSIVRDKINSYLSEKPNLVNYGEEVDRSSLSNNLVYILLDTLESKSILSNCTEDKLKYRNRNGTFNPNSNLFNAFDNTEYNESESDRYPLITLYGVDSICDITELTDNWSLLVFDDISVNN